MKVGTAKYGSGKKMFKIKDGDNVYRILPPLGKLADAGKWSQYYRVEWGYKNSKNQNRPFLDCRVVNRETKMVEVESSAHLRREELKTKKEEMITAGAPKDQLEQIGKLIERFNQDAKHYINVVNLNGQIGLLKLGHKAKLSLDAEIVKLRQQGVDPLGVTNGIFFNFFRNNPGTTFRDITTTATVFKENIKAVVNGVETIVQQDKIHVMDDAFLSRLGNEAFELSGMYPTPTAEEVTRMVNEGETAIDEILGFREEYNPTSATVNEAAKKVVETVTTPLATPVVETVTTPLATPVVETVTATAVHTPVETPVQTTTPTPVASALSDDDFLKKIGATS